MLLAAHDHEDRRGRPPSAPRCGQCRLARDARPYRCYGASLAGSRVDLRNERNQPPEIHDPSDWNGSQAYGERLRTAGEDGIAYGSLRHVGGVNVVAYEPRQVLDVTIGPSFDLIVPIEGRIIARRLA